jgi:hypothetical protein
MKKRTKPSRRRYLDLETLYAGPVGLRSLTSFLWTSIRDDFVQSVRLYFSPISALRKDFAASDSQLKTLSPSRT